MALKESFYSFTFAHLNSCVFFNSYLFLNLSLHLLFFFPSRYYLMYHVPQVTKSRAPLSLQRSLTFEVDYPEAEGDVQPRHRWVTNIIFHHVMLCLLTLCVISQYFITSDTLI